MVKRKISFYEGKKKKTWTLHKRKSSYYEFSGWVKRSYYGFLGGKGDLFQRRKLVERSFLIIYEICMIF